MGSQHKASAAVYRFTGVGMALWLLVLLCAPVAALAQQSVPPFAEGVLFRVERGDAAPSHVFGTIHAEDPRVLDLPDEVESAFAASEQFVMEVIMDVATLAASAKAMLFTDGRTLETEVGAERYQQALALLAERGYPELMVRMLKPWAVATVLSTPAPETGEFLDLVLYQRALAAGMAVHGLESVDEQLGIFDALSSEEQLVVLDDALENQELMPLIYQRLLGAYLDRDLAELMAVNSEYLEDGDRRLAGKITSMVVDKRNRHMAERMAMLIDAGGAFVAVGALHLPGETGVLRLLEQQGYQVTRVY